MKPQLSKIKTYIGFAIRSRQIIYGVDDIIKRDFKGLVMMSNALAESSANKLKSHISKIFDAFNQLGLEIEYSVCLGEKEAIDIAIDHYGGEIPHFDTIKEYLLDDYMG